MHMYAYVYIYIYIYMYIHTGGGSLRIHKDFLTSLAWSGTLTARRRFGFLAMEVPTVNVKRPYSELRK